jgi:hypothetical protein
VRARFIWLALALASCSAEPRSPAYFEAHPTEAAKVLKACVYGSHRGEECTNAEAAAVKSRRDARMERYKKAFD